MRWGAAVAAALLIFVIGTGSVPVGTPPLHVGKQSSTVPWAAIKKEALERMSANGLMDPAFRGDKLAEAVNELRGAVNKIKAGELVVSHVHKEAHKKSAQQKTKDKLAQPWQLWDVGVGDHQHNMPKPVPQPAAKKIMNKIAFKSWDLTTAPAVQPKSNSMELSKASTGSAAGAMEGSAGAPASAKMELVSSEKSKQQLEEDFEIRRCVFIHGTGHMKETEPENEDPDGFGSIVHELGCTEVLVPHVNSIAKAWFDEPWGRKLCQVAVGASPDGVIRNTTIFSYSAGTLALGAGIERGLCDIDTYTTRWYALAYPHMLEQENGQNVGTQIHHSLRDGNDLMGLVSWTMSGYVDSSVLKAYLHDPDSGKPFARMIACFDAEDLDDCPNAWPPERREKVHEIVKSRVSGVMCGKSGRLHTLESGWIVSSNTVETLQNLVMPFDGPNDGLVPLYSCSSLAPNRDAFGVTPDSKYYLADMNHYELQGGTGDGSEPDQKPNEWMRQRRMGSSKLAKQTTTD